MLLLETQIGDFLLHNALRIDIYRTKEEKIWMSHLSIDGNKQALHGFETERDAIIFGSWVMELLTRELCAPSGREWVKARLHELCEIALKETIEQGLVE